MPKELKNNLNGIDMEMLNEWWNEVRFNLLFLNNCISY